MSFAALSRLLRPVNVWAAGSACLDSVIISKKLASLGSAFLSCEAWALDLFHRAPMFGLGSAVGAVRKGLAECLRELVREQRPEFGCAQHSH